MIKVFGTEWFQKYNIILVRIARLPFIGDWIFNFKKFGHFVDRTKIVSITPNSVVEFVSWKKGYEEVELRQHFFVRNEYALRLQHVFYPVWITFHIWDIITRPIPQLNLGFDTLEVNSDINSGATTVDGYAGRHGVNETLATIIAGGGTESNVSGTQLSIFITTSSTTNQFSRIRRAIMTFDTSSLTSGANISDAILTLYIGSKFNGLGGQSYDIVGSTPANNNNIVNADYSQLGSTSFSNKAYADINISDPYNNDFVFNASGKSAISKTGITGLGIRGHWDLTGTFSGTWSIGTSDYLSPESTESTGYKPKLVVTYTITTANTTNFFFD